MSKIDWKSKLSSRKFWCCVVGFVTAVLVACNVDNGTVEQVTAIITSAGVLVAYIVSEAAVDVAREKKNEEQG